MDALFEPIDTPSFESLFPLMAKRRARIATHAALAVQPELAPAHFLRGWQAYQDDDFATAWVEVQLAAALAPTDGFYQTALTHLATLDPQ